MVDDTPHIALVGVKAFSNDGIKLCKEVIKDIVKASSIIKISSIYRVKGSESWPGHIHDIRKVMDFEGLSFSIQLSTEKTPAELMKLLTDIERKHRSEIHHRSLSLNLLVYENQTMMTESLTLPHPEFHTKPEILFPAAEIWGEYFHPILKKTLHTLTRDFANLRWGEFHEQGKTLLDF